MKTRRETKSDRCDRCKVNYRLCFCEFLKPIEIKTPVQIIMHIGELNLTSNTVNLLKKVHENCSVNIRGDKNNQIDYKDLLLEDTHEPLYLFPDENAIPLNLEFLTSLKKPINLIVPDGTWRQAKKIKRRVSEFENIKSVTLPEKHYSKYKLRNSPKIGMLSTFEAISKALGIIEGNEVEERLNKIFKIMVQQNLKARARPIDF